MAKCALCSCTLNFLNKPAFGQGKFQTGERLCTICYQKVAKYDSSVIFNFKEYTIEQVREIVGMNIRSNVPNSNDTISTNQSDLENDDIPSKIEKLHNLLEKGILTNEEFDKKKAELLSKL